MQCPVCGNRVFRMQRTDPPLHDRGQEDSPAAQVRKVAELRSIACAYPCNDWLTHDQAVAIRDSWRQRHGDPAGNTPTEHAAAAA